MFVKGRVLHVLVNFFEEDYRRIEHACDVLHHSEIILADHPEADSDIVYACALLHDVGIKPAEELFGYNNGKLQEEYGPAVAKELLESIDFPAEKVVKVMEIIGNHHSPSRYDYAELEILKKADSIVNNKESAGLRLYRQIP